jgi:hypothetical protein
LRGRWLSCCGLPDDDQVFVHALSLLCWARSEM